MMKNQKYVEGNKYGLIAGTMPAFVWRDKREKG
jgi:hypothetical protein